MTESSIEEAGPSGPVSSSFHIGRKCSHDIRTCVECGEQFECCSMHAEQRTCSKLCWNRHFRQGSQDGRIRRSTKKMNPERDDQRWCSACSEWKSLDQFRTKSGNIQSRCKPCASAYQVEWRNANLEKVRATQRAHSRRRYSRTRYGLEREEFDARVATAMLAGCEICGRFNENGKPLHQDHCHTSNVLRGFLCENCNRALGMMKDDADRLRAAADYLERHAAV